MSRAADVLLGGLRLWPTADGALIVSCGRDCGHIADLAAGATVTDQLAGGMHACPRKGEVAAGVLASVETLKPVLVGGSVHLGRRDINR